MLLGMVMMMTKGSFHENDIRNVWNMWQKISPQLDGIRPCVWLLSMGLFKEKLWMLSTTSFSISTCASCIINPIITTAITPYQRIPRWVSLSTNLANHCQSLTAYEDMAFFTYLLTLSVRWAHNAIASHSSLVLSLWLLLLDVEYSCALDRTHLLMSSVLIRLYLVHWTCSHSLLSLLWLVFMWVHSP